MAATWRCVLAALLATACTAKTEKAAETAAPAMEAPAAKRMPLPDCASVEPSDAGDKGWTHPDCRMMAAGDSGVAFEVRYAESNEPGGPPTKVSIQVVGPGDATLQTITEGMESTFAAPRLYDLNRDGVDELLVPLETGNVNTNYAVWAKGPGEAPYLRAGEVSAFAFDWSDAGYVAALSRSAANIQVVEFLKLVDGKLAPIVRADITAEGEENGKVTGTTCDITDEGGMAAEGLTLEAAKAKFCEDKLVKAAFE